MIMGLDRPTSGAVPVNGMPYAKHDAPLREVGALLDAKAVHTCRTPTTTCWPWPPRTASRRKRVHEVIELTGLGAVAKKRVGGFSLGMGQRLGIAAALLGDPQTVILDEPVNGLDPEGVRLGPQPGQGARRRGPHGVPLQPPDERDGRSPRTT